MTDWRPSATLPTLKRRAAVFADIRRFFAARDVLEVDTPLRTRYPVTDEHLDNLYLQDGHCLATSPEYPMKRLLAAGLGDIYQLGHVFRADEAGARHNVEFTLLEWYRLGWDDERLMSEVAELCRTLAGDPAIPVAYTTYRDAFLAKHLPDPLNATVDELRRATADQLGAAVEGWSRDACLDALMALVVEPGLDPERLTFVTRYPASQAALARVEQSDMGPVGRRFELYWRGMELANGYWELTDAEEQTRRFEADRARRRRQGQAVPPVDERLLQALRSGLPECAGVALGVDRLLMVLLGKKQIREVLPFDASRA